MSDETQTEAPDNLEIPSSSQERVELGDAQVSMHTTVVYESPPHNSEIQSTSNSDSPIPSFSFPTLSSDVMDQTMNPQTSNPQLSTITEEPQEHDTMAIYHSQLMQTSSFSDQAIGDSNLETSQGVSHLSGETPIVSGGQGASLKITTQSTLVNPLGQVSTDLVSPTTNVVVDALIRLA